DPASRFLLEDVRRHPWYTRENRYLTPDGRLGDPINLATSMFESLHIDLTRPVSRVANGGTPGPDRMDVDIDDMDHRLPSTQPEMVRADMLVDWDMPHLADTFSSTQPSGRPLIVDDTLLADNLEEEP